jgi:hypothetical protein
MREDTILESNWDGDHGTMTGSLLKMIWIALGFVFSDERWTPILQFTP